MASSTPPPQFTGPEAQLTCEPIAEQDLKHAPFAFIWLHQCLPGTLLEGPCRAPVHDEPPGRTSGPATLGPQGPLRMISQMQGLGSIHSVGNIGRGGISSTNKTRCLLFGDLDCLSRGRGSSPVSVLRSWVNPFVMLDYMCHTSDQSFVDPRLTCASYLRWNWAREAMASISLEDLLSRCHL